MKDIIIIYCIPTEIVNAILMLYNNTRSMVRSPDGDTPFFDITIVYWSTTRRKTCTIYMHYMYPLYIEKISGYQFTSLFGVTLSKEKAIDTPMYTLPILTMLTI